MEMEYLDCSDDYTNIYIRNKMPQNYTRILNQCQFPGIDVILYLYKM